MNDLTKSFFKLESDLNLFEWRIDGYPIWERIRFGLARQIKEQQGSGQAHTRSPLGMEGWTKGLALWLRGFVKNNPFLAGEHEVLFVGHPRRKLEPDGTWWDIYCDPIHNKCNLDSLHVESDYLRGHRRPPNTDNIRYLDVINYSSTALRKLGIGRVSLRRRDKRKISDLEEAILEEFGVDLDLNDIIRKKLRFRQTKLWQYDRLLKTINPAYVVVVVGYGRQTIIEACNNTGIPVVELLHGVIHPGHLGYTYPDDVSLELFPDYLLVWGEFWKHQTAFPLPDERIIPVGFPYLEQTVNRYENVDPRDQILFISQGTIGEQLSQFAMEVNQHPDIDHEVIYKLHPGEYDRWDEEYPWLLDADLEIIDNADTPLYQLFAESDVQVGVSSTAVYEGLAFDLETYVYDCPGADVLEPLIEEESAELISSADDLAASLGTDQNSFEKDYYFAPNAIDTMCEVLERLADVGTQYRQHRC